MQTPQETLHRYWGYDAFRPLQADIVQTVLDGHDALALLPTGGGKSICFQVPVLCHDAGMAIVISPLIALMKDQVANLNRRGIAATYINSALNSREIDLKLSLAMEGRYRFLYIAPERIASAQFLKRLAHMPVTLLAVDEAHCVSQWGYDFRPAYLDIPRIREVKPRIPLLALTASAPPDVQRDLPEKLGMRAPRVFEQSFRRDNLRYFVLPEENVAQRIASIAQKTAGTGIVYVRTRKRTTHVADLLVRSGVSAAAYHGGLTTSERDEIQQAWMEGKHRVMVATNAFGMGIDKPDVRFVLHYNLPADPESYYQEAGRGGRDGQMALAIAFRNPADLRELNEWTNERYPEWEEVQQCYQALCAYYRISTDSDGYDEARLFDIATIAETHKLPMRRLHAAVRILHDAGVIEVQEEADDFGYLQFAVAPETVLTFRENHPKFAALLEFILRQAGGAAFTDEIRFLPNRWLSKLGWQDIGQLHLQLNGLVSYGIIVYRPPVGEPQITFRTPRHTLTKHEVQWERVIFLRDRAQTRLRVMETYINSDEPCRSLQLQRYFGENAISACGKCDVCVGRNRQRLADSEWPVIVDAIVAFVREREAEGGCFYREVVLQVRAGAPAQREAVLRELLDHGRLRADAYGRLSMP